MGTTVPAPRVPLLPRAALIVGGVILAVVEALQVSIIHVPAGWHDGISAVVIATGAFGLVPLAPAAIFKLIPVHVAGYLTSFAMAAEIIQRQALHLGLGFHTACSVVLVLAATLGISPLTPSHNNGTNDFPDAARP